MVRIIRRIMSVVMAGALLIGANASVPAEASAKKPALAYERVSILVGDSTTIKIKNTTKKSVKKLTVSVKDKSIVSAVATGAGKKTAIRIDGKKTGSTTIYLKIKTKKTYKLSLTVRVAKKEKQEYKPIKADRAGFSIWPITDELFYRMKQGNTYKEDCIVPREDLRYIQALHKDKDGNVHQGEMVVHKLIAEDVLEILEKLYDADYPIERMVLPDNYMADDETQMRDNNSSSFNFRFISHTTTVSKHGLGMAVDFNTLYNPYHKFVTNEDGTVKELIEPATGAPYLDRTKDFDYKIEKDDLCYRLFIEKGFEWGGDWTDRKDYQHFELPTSITSVYSDMYSKGAKGESDGDKNAEAIGIIGAMEEEVSLLKKTASIKKTTKIAGMEFCEGTIEGKNVVIVQCGMGKVNAGICANTLINNFGCVKIINSGVAGSLDNKLDIGDIVVSVDAVQHDFTVEAIGFAKGEIPYTGLYAFPADESMRRAAVAAVQENFPNIHVYEGRICSGDQFISDKEQKEKIVSDFGGLCCEMEGAAIAQTCYLNGTPFVVLRAISDKSDGSHSVEYESFKKEAAETCAKSVLAMLKNIKLKSEGNQ